MPFDAGAIKGRITIDHTQADRAIGATQRKAREFRDTHRKSHERMRTDIDRTVQRSYVLQRAFAGIISAATIRSFVRAQTELDRINNTLIAAVGSAEAAGREYEFIAREADRLGLNLQRTALNYAQLMAASRGTALEGRNTRDIFIAVAEASTVLGMSAQQTEGALRAIEQMISKGNVQAEELRGQLGERLPGAFQIAARAMGVTTQELNKMLDDGEVLADELLPALAVELRKTFGPQVEQAAQSAQAKINRLQTAAFEAKTALLALGGSDVVAGSIGGLAEGLGTLADLLDTNTVAAKDLQIVGHEAFGFVANAIDDAALAAVKFSSEVSNKAIVTLLRLQLRALEVLETVGEIRNSLPGADVDVSGIGNRVSATQKQIAALEQYHDRYIQALEDVNDQRAREREEITQAAEDERNAIQARIAQREREINAESAGVETVISKKKGLSKEEEKIAKLRADILAGYDEEVQRLQDTLDFGEDIAEVMAADREFQQQMQGRATTADRQRIANQIQLAQKLQDELDAREEAVKLAEEQRDREREITEEITQRGANIRRTFGGFDDDVTKARNVLQLGRDRAEIENAILDLQRQFPGLSDEQIAGFRRQLETLQDINEAIARQTELEGIFTRGLEDAVFEGENLAQVFANVTEQIAQMAFRMAVIQPIAERLAQTMNGAIWGDAETGEGGGVNWLKTGLSAGLGIFTGGAKAAAKGALLTRPTLFGSAEGLTLGGEAGTEAIMPLGRTGSGDLGVKALGGGEPINININVAVTRDRILSDVDSPEGRAVTVRAVEMDKRKNGSSRRGRYD